jgi:hypothetical protein
MVLIESKVVSEFNLGLEFELSENQFFPRWFRHFGPFFWQFVWVPLDVLFFYMVLGDFDCLWICIFGG